MTGMVPMVATLLSLPSGRAKSAAGRPNSQSGEASTHLPYPGTGETLLPVFQEKK